MQRLLSGLCCVLFSISLSIPVHAATAQAELIFSDADDVTEQRIRQSLQDSAVIAEAVDLINETLVLDKPLAITLSAGEEGPHFDPEKFEIVIPYGFVTEVEGRFEKAKYAETGVSVEEATSDALMHTLFHELAHALIFLYELPVVGKEEDAADGLATVLLIEYFEDGAEIALSAADLFALESEDTGNFTNEDFWDEHSLDIQRYYTTLCYVYGSNPSQRSSLKKDIGFSGERAELCEEQYATQVNSWMDLLSPYLRKP